MKKLDNGEKITKSICILRKNSKEMLFQHFDALKENVDTKGVPRCHIFKNSMYL